MSFTDNNQDQPQDPYELATSQMLYGSPEEAAQHFRAAVERGVNEALAQQAHVGRINAAHQKSMSALSKFVEQNPAYADPIVQAGGRAAMLAEQYRDLLDSGAIDPAKFQQETGRLPTEADVFNMHLRGRAAGVKGLRTEEELLGAVGQRLYDKFGIRPHVEDIDRSRKEGVLKRQEVSAHRRGMSLDQYLTEVAPQSRQPNVDSRGEPVTTESIQQATLRSFGSEVDDAADAARLQVRKSAIQQMKEARTGPNNMRFSRTAADYQYPDRQQGTG